MRLIDTDILVDIRRGHPPALDWFDNLSDVPSVTGFTVMELIQGCSNKAEVSKVRTLVAPFPIAWPFETDYDTALSRFGLYHLGHRLGMIDMLIAACALGRDATLCTFNVKHFRSVAGLIIEQPYIR